jgi:hypothetical protein
VSSETPFLWRKMVMEAFSNLSREFELIWLILWGKESDAPLSKLDTLVAICSLAPRGRGSRTVGMC